MPDLGLQHVTHSMRGAEHHGVCDEALFKFLWGEMGEEKAGRRMEAAYSQATGEPGLSTGRAGNGQTRTGPHVPSVGKGRQDPTAVSQGMHQPAGMAKEGTAGSHLLSGDRPGTCLDLPHLVGLELRGAVVVNETNTAHQLGWKGSTIRVRAQPSCSANPISESSLPFSPPTPGTPPWCPTHSHGNGHVGFCHSVHRGGDQWRLQGDLPSQG